MQLRRCMVLGMINVRLVGTVELKIRKIAAHQLYWGRCYLLGKPASTWCQVGPLSNHPRSDPSFYSGACAHLSSSLASNSKRVSPYGQINTSSPKKAKSPIRVPGIANPFFRFVNCSKLPDVAWIIVFFSLQRVLY